VANGPSTPNERWENQSGFSPNTIAAEIAGLVCAADIARRNGDTTRAKRYADTADTFQKMVQTWTATTNGPYSPDPYYLRLSKDGNPNDGTTYDPGDNHVGEEDERAIVEWVDRITLDPAGVTDDLVARLLDHVREDQLVEITVLAGAIRMLNQYCTAFDIPPPG
jgi:glucoamylase